MKLRIALVIAIAFFSNVAFATEVNDVVLRDVKYPLHGKVRFSPLDQAITLSLIENGWQAEESSPGRIVADITVRNKHFLKIELKYTEDLLTVHLLDSSNMRVGECVTVQDANGGSLTCIHPKYYEWVQSVLDDIPMSDAKLHFLKSVIAAPSK